MVGDQLAQKYEFEKLALLAEHGKLGDFLKTQGDEKLLGGWLGQGLDGQAITIVDPAPSEEAQMAARYRGVRVNPAMAEVAPPAVLFLAIKPQTLDEAAPRIAPRLGASPALGSGNE